MASFDQNVPQIAPDPLSYTRLAKGIETPKPDVSKATLIKGVTDTLETGINAADETLKKHAEYLGEQMGEKEQSDFLSNVQTADNLVNKRENIPSQLAGGLNFIARNQDAYDQGKLRETEYLRNLYEKAKSLRTQWPSYRDYIDRGVEKATGITPNANQLIKSLLQDINDKKSKEDKYKDQVLRDAVTQAAAGNTAALLGIKNLQDGKIDHTGLLGTLTKSNSLEWQAKDARSSLEIVTAGDRMNQIPATKIIQQDYAEQSQHVWDSFRPSIPGMESTKSMADLLLEREQGKSTLTDDQWLAIGQQFDAAVSHMNADRNKFYNQIDPKTKQSLKMMAGDKFEETIKNSGSLLADMRKNITDKDLGGMANTEVANKIQTAKDTQTLRGDPLIGPMMGITSGLKSLGGEQFPGLVYSQLAPVFGDSFSRNNLTLLATKMASGANYSLNRAVDAMASAAKTATGDVNEAQIRHLVKDIPVTTITRPDVTDAVKRSMILNTFGPDDFGILAKIPANTIANGKEIQGRQSVYEAYTSPKMISEIKRIADDGHPRLWEFFKQWNINEFGTDLFGDDVNRLSQISKQINYDIHFQDGAGTSPPKFIGFLRRRANTPEGQMTPVSDDIQKTIDNVNKAVIGLYNVYKAEGGTTEDVKAHLLNVFQAHNVNPNEGNSLARQMLIGISVKKPEKDQSKAKQNE